MESFNGNFDHLKIPSYGRQSFGRGFGATSSTIDFMKISAQLIFNCQTEGFTDTAKPFGKNQTASFTNFNQSGNSIFKKSLSRLPTYVLDPHQPNPQEK